MMERRDLSVCRGSLQMSIPSITIFPGESQHRLLEQQSHTLLPNLLWFFKKNRILNKNQVDFTYPPKVLHADVFL